MRLLPLFLMLITALLPALHAEESASAQLDRRLISLVAVAAPTEDDRLFLETRAKETTADGCVAVALLFRNWPDEYRDGFARFYGIDPAVKTTVLTDSEINARVNGRLRELPGRHPLDVTSQLYLMFRRSGRVAKQDDGTELSLEVMFRGAVFTGVTQGNVDEVLRFSAIADGKTPQS